MVPWHWNYDRSWLGRVLLSGKERSWTPKIPGTHPGNHWVVDSWNSWVIWEELKKHSDGHIQLQRCKGLECCELAHFFWEGGMVGMMVFRRKSQGALSQECNHKLLPSPLSQTLSKLGGWRMAKVIKLVFMSDLLAFSLLENWLNPHVWIPLLLSPPWKFRYLRHVCCILGFSINLSKATCHRKEMFLWSLDDFNFPVSDCPMFFEEQTLRELFGVS